MTTEPSLYAPASIWIRLANYILDRIIVGSAMVAINVPCILIFHKLSPWILLLEVFLYLIYFVIFESIWQRSVAKWITGTKVVMRDGSKPPFLNIIGRSFARYIPFEQISFVFSMNPAGWHDRLSKTIVVPSSYSVDDVKKIDFERIKKENGSNVALVVILLAFFMLVMIAIIGILSSVVLVSLASARNKAHDGQIRYDLAQVRVAMETQIGDNLMYPKGTSCSDGVFASDAIHPILINIEGQNIPDQRLACYSTGSSYAVSAMMASSKSDYCVDSTGFKGEAMAVSDGKTAACVAQSLDESSNN